MEGCSETVNSTQLVDTQAYYRDVETPDITRVKHTDEVVKRLIHALPKDMRRDRWSRTNKDLCNTHQGLNANLMSDLFHLVQREVGRHLRKFDAYPNLLKPLDVLIIEKLHAIQGMWKKPDPYDRGAPNAWHYEISRCQGCMVARVASDKHALRNLRIVLLSRTQTRLKHVPRRLIKFVDTCIDLFPDDLDELYGTSGQFAYILKDTRKACSKAWSRDPARAQSSRRRRRHSDHEKGEKGYKDDKSKRGIELARSHRSINEYGPRKNYVQSPRPITTPHPAERYVPGSSASSFARRTDTDTNTETKGGSIYRPTSSLSREASRSPYQMKRDRQCFPNPDRITRLMDFADDNHQGLGIRATGQSASSVYRPPDNSPLPSVRSTACGDSNKIDEVMEMYKSMGANPYSRNTMDGSNEVPLNCSSPSIYSTSSEGSDEGHDRSETEILPGARTTWDLVCEQSNMI
ncbi:hypothetical protein N7475_010127 [Penicillium sp. IBT 31633x]|nr:hypothetical protein N7475_010127 [Penicillium sp. IBT 31633x]